MTWQLTASNLLYILLDHDLCAVLRKFMRLAKERVKSNTDYNTLQLFWRHARFFVWSGLARKSHGACAMALCVITATRDRLPCVTSPSGRECWLQGHFWQCLRLCGPPQEVQDAEDAVQNGEATANPTGCRSKTLESMCEFDVFARTIRIVAGLTILNLMYKQYW